MALDSLKWKVCYTSNPSLKYSSNESNTLYITFANRIPLVGTPDALFTDIVYDLSYNCMYTRGTFLADFNLYNLDSESTSYLRSQVVGTNYFGEERYEASSGPDNKALEKANLRALVVSDNSEILNKIIKEFGYHIDPNYLSGYDFTADAYCLAITTVGITTTNMYKVLGYCPTPIKQAEHANQWVGFSFMNEFKFPTPTNSNDLNAFVLVDKAKYDSALASNNIISAGSDGIKYFLLIRNTLTTGHERANNPCWGIGGAGKLQTGYGCWHYIRYENTINDKIHDLELFKFPNTTIFGLPLIQQGLISNFSDDNYLQFPFIVNFLNMPWKIDMCITTGSSVSGLHNIFDSEFGLAAAIRNGEFVLAYSTNGTSWENEHVSSTSLLANTTYYIRILHNGVNTYTVTYSTNKVTYNPLLTFTGNTPYPKTITIGKSILNTGYGWNGSINLNECSLTISDELVWSGMDDAGLSTRLAVNLNNLDNEGVLKINDIIDLKVGVFNTENPLESTGIYKAIIDNEQVTSAALIELNNKLEDLFEYVKPIDSNVSNKLATIDLKVGSFNADSPFDSTGLYKIIIENEEVTASAINILDLKIKELDKTIKLLQTQLNGVLS